MPRLFYSGTDYKKRPPLTWRYLSKRTGVITFTPVRFYRLQATQPIFIRFG